MRMSRKGKVLYERDAVNPEAPRVALVSDTGYAVTLDEWDQPGYDHALVIYAPDGSLVVDRRLEELLVENELPNLEETASSRRWAQVATPPRISHDLLVIPMVHGQDIHVRLRDGQRLEGSVPLPIPTDEQRYTEYVTGKRAWDAVTIELHENDARGGAVCTVDVTRAACKPWGKTTQRKRGRKVSRAAVATALSQTLPLGALANTEPGSNLPGPHWLVVVRFAEASGVSYDYKVLVSRDAPPADRAAAVAALRALTPLR